MIKRGVTESPNLNFEPDKLMRAHLEKTLRSLNLKGSEGRWARLLIERLGTIELENIAMFAKDKMQMAIKDSRRHSMAISKEDIHINISVFPCSITEAKKRYYPQGYLDYLNQALITARNENPTGHFIHFQFFYKLFLY